MSTGIYQVSHNGPGNIVWKKLSDTTAQGAVQIAGSAASVAAAGLSLVAVVQNQILLQRVQKISVDVKIVDAKFDLLFLDRSIEHFLAVHNETLGINGPALSALCEDCENALSQLVLHKNLRVPAYLRQKALAIAQAVFMFNQFIYASIHNGQLNWLENARIEAWAKKIKSLQGSNPEGGLVSQSDVLNIWRSELVARQQQDKSTRLSNLLPRPELPLTDNACAPENSERTNEILHLYREVEAAGRFLNVLADKLIADKKELLLVVSK